MLCLRIIFPFWGLIPQKTIGYLQNTRVWFCFNGCVCFGRAVLGGTNYSFSSFHTFFKNNVREKGNFPGHWKARYLTWAVTAWKGPWNGWLYELFTETHAGLCAKSWHCISTKNVLPYFIWIHFLYRRASNPRVWCLSWSEVYWSAFWLWRVSYSLTCM